MIRVLVAAGLLLLGGCALPALQMGAAALGIAAGTTTLIVNGPKVAAEVQGWVDPRALDLPPQP
jgi:hypothetical protein